VRDAKGSGARLHSILAPRAADQLEKARLVAKLKAARERKREAEGKCEGRKSYLEAKPEP
jgi:hypothetical protein